MEDVAFVDDMALPIVATAENLIEHVSQVCTLIHLTFQVFGMVLNYAPGKSAAVLHVCGKGKRKPFVPLRMLRTKSCWILLILAFAINTLASFLLILTSIWAQ